MAPAGIAFRVTEAHKPPHRSKVTTQGEEVRSVIDSLLGPITKVRLGTWNVRTMYETSKLAQVISEMKRYRLDILGISECRWTGSGCQTTSDGSVILYSGQEDKHIHGVALIVSKEKAKTLVEWEPVSDRMIRARFNSKHCKLTIIQCYAPTNEAEKEDKDDWYEELQRTVSKVPQHDMLLIIGDMNAKVGADNDNCDRAIGSHGCGVRNNNGERLVDFCLENNCVVGGTIFPHKNIHKLTWRSPDGLTTNQINHILINGKWRRSPQDVRVCRGADANSDHYLVTANIRLKLRKVKQQGQRRRQLDIGKLKCQNISKEFVLELRNRFGALGALADSTDEDPDIYTKWETIKNTYVETATKIQGHREKKNKEWLTPEHPANPTPADNILNINTSPPTETEVKSAIKATKNGKAAGIDSIHAEMLKADLNTSVKVLTDLFRNIWDRNVIPEDWAKVLIAKIPKKGNLQNCNNWRGITLLSIPSKVFCKVLLGRIDMTIDTKLRQEQAGFRKGRGCTDQIFTLRNIIEQCMEWNNPLHINFINFQKAFDSLHRDTLWKIVQSYGIPPKMTALTRMFYHQFECSVIVNGNLTEWFPVEFGVRQGCIISPILFLIAIDWTMRKTTSDKPRGIQWTLFTQLEDLDYADDLPILSTNHTHLQEKTNRTDIFAKQMEKISNEDLHKNTNCHNVVLEIKHRRLKWLGHVLRMDQDRIPKKE
ncbi:uncharacterized protein LOC139917505 [Centroberyx gerrardi]